MVESGKQIFQATLPPGPIWVGNYNASEATSNSNSNDVGTMTSSDSNITQVDELQSGKGGGVSKGGIAAAVLIPLIFIGLALGYYIRRTRSREAKNRKRWSEKVDQRMSTLSIDWRAMSTKGAEAAIRASMADPNRASVWLGNEAAPRPSSTFASEGGASDVVDSQMAQIRRPGVGLRNPVPGAAGAPRTSRISFAPDTRFSRVSGAEGFGRTSNDTRRSQVTSRAFHSAYIPPVPSRLSEFAHDGHAGSDSGSADGGDNSNISSGMVSPTQREGAYDLSDADIQAALTMVNMPAPAKVHESPLHVDTGIASYAVPFSAPSPPPTVRSPIMGAMPMAAMLDEIDTASPDAVLRAYAERRRTGASILSPTGTPVPQIQGMRVVSPPPVASPGATPMRALYSPAPTIPEHQAAQVVNVESNNPFRKSVHHDDDAYFGTAQ